MAKNTLIGISGLARKIGKIYIGVGGYARKVKKGYIGISGMARLFYTGDPVLIFEQSTAGTVTQDLAAGTYEITLIGGGGGGVVRRSTTSGANHYAQGGVGGTVQVIAKLDAPATVTIVIGSGGTTNSGTFSSASSGTLTGGAGTASKITGFTNLTLQANSGTAASIKATSTTGSNRNVGVIGAITASGTALQEILISNPNSCTSQQGTSTASTRTGSGRVNDNWPEDTTRGKSGDGGWNGTAFRLISGAAGFARIRQL